MDIIKQAVGESIPRAQDGQYNKIRFKFLSDAGCERTELYTILLLHPELAEKRMQWLVNGPFYGAHIHSLFRGGWLSLHYPNFLCMVRTRMKG